MTLLTSSSGRPYSTTDAKVQVVLPQLTELRLVALTRSLSRNRKQFHLAQGNLDTELLHHEHYLTREHKLSNDRYYHVSAPYRKSVTNIRGIQLCLQRRKTDLYLDKGTQEKYGSYGGLQVKSLKNEIDKMLKDNDYDHIKQRQTKRLLADGQSDGRIMNIKKCIPMLDAILTRPSLPKRREKLLGFDSPPPEDPGEGLEGGRRRVSGFHLPPVKATRLHSPAKKLHPRQDDGGGMPLDRANTIA